ncbi:MAG TPA: bifunctional tetrahydrofolate synthase/dihydrofolate synthase [Burkholderiaceae bacterium]|nr:bifunctional tetrahydrofolate synthase/dihydrofolate synthase [Burkholderiaceae bacterium]
MTADATTLDAWLERIERLHGRPIDLTLERVREVARRLGLVSSCPTFIVGGTNGKGSTCAMLDAILRAAGYKVGLYTSPHLLTFNERARIDGVLATDAALIEQFEAVEAARGATTLTYFEFTTLAILRLFQQARLDALVLEIGLGGRLDAVNIVDPDCSILTSVDIDHTAYLGPTRESIGFEKAHIFRHGRPAICAEPRPPKTVLDVAQELGADLWLAGRDFSHSGDRQQWAYHGRNLRRASLPYPALRGANQLLNASGALAALEAVSGRLPISQQAVRQGLLTVEIPARFQVLPGRPAVVLDVAHNPHAAAVLAANLDNMGFYPRTHAVFGMLRDKDVAGVIARIGARVDRWHIGPTPGARGADSEWLASQVRAVLAEANKPDVVEHATLVDAYAAALGEADVDDRIIVFGSFTTVAEVMRARASVPAGRDSKL